MIFDAVGGFLLGLASAIFGALPDAGDLGLEGIGDAVGLMRSLNGALPVSESLVMAAGCLTIIGGIFSWRLLVTLWGLIPFKSS